MPFLKPAARYPADPRAVFILALSVFSGCTALALEAAPDSLNALLPAWVVVAWSVLLVLGSALTLAGMAFQSVGGIVTEQVGSVTVAATTIFYAVLAIKEIGPDAIQGVGIVLAWGLSCVLRWAQLQVLINDAHRRAAKIAFLNRLEDELVRRAEERQAREQAHPGWFH